MEKFQRLADFSDICSKTGIIKNSIVLESLRAEPADIIDFL